MILFEIIFIFTLGIINLYFFISNQFLINSICAGLCIGYSIVKFILYFIF